MDCKLIFLAVCALLVITASAEEYEDIQDYKSYAADLAAAYKKSISKTNDEDYDVVRRNPWFYQRSSTDLKATKKQTSNVDVSHSKPSSNLELQKKLVITIEELEKKEDKEDDSEQDE